MIDKLAGLPTQIRQLEKRLKEMDASKVKPALVKEITDTIKNLKDMLKEKQDKREQRKKDKESAAPAEVQKEAITVPSATEIGAVAPNSITTTQPGQPEATPTSPGNKKISCPLCGGMQFSDQGQYQQHMEFTHASDIMPTTPGQKLNDTVATADPAAVTVEAGPKCALCGGVEFPDYTAYTTHRETEHGRKDYVPMDHNKKKDVIRDVEKRLGPAILSEQEPAAPESTDPQFKLDDQVKPIRGSESKGKVMRWDGKPNDLVYVMWESGPLAERDTFGGYYPHDLQAVAQEPVEAVAAPVVEEPVCQKCADTQAKHGDLKTNYDALLKDLQEEREIHYTQGNHSWVARLDQKIKDLQDSIAEKFGDLSKKVDGGPESVSQATSNTEKTAIGGPDRIRRIDRANTGHGYSGIEYDMTNGRFVKFSDEEGSARPPIGIGDTNVRRRQPENGLFEVKYPGQEWRPVLEPEFNQWFAIWTELNQKNNQKEGAAENAEHLTIMDHTPPRANSGPDAGGKDSFDEFQDEWAMPLTAATKINVLKRELLATPTENGYDISHEGKKLFNIKGKEGMPLNKKQLEFCAQIEFTRGMKQAKLVEKIANLEAGSTVFIMAHDKTSKRVKFASLEHGYRGWASASKFAYLVKEGQMMQHKDHIDNTFGNNGKQVLVDCPNGSGNMVWLQMGELLPINPPPATPESLNDLESALECKYCAHRPASHTDGKGNSAGCSICDCSGYKKAEDKTAGQKFECGGCGKQKDTDGGVVTVDKQWHCPKCGAAALKTKRETKALQTALPKAILPQRGDVNETPAFDPMNGPSDELVQQKAYEMFKQHWDALGSKEQDAVYKALGVVSSKKRPFSKKADALTDHITDMKGRMTDVQESFQNAPAVKLADQVTDETIEISTNDPNFIDPTNPLSPEEAVADPMIRNVQPTDNDNLAVPVVAPTSPLPTGQKWVFDTQFNKYVAMPDPNAAGKQI